MLTKLGVFWPDELVHPVDFSLSIHGSFFDAPTAGAPERRLVLVGKIDDWSEEAGGIRGIR